MYRLGRISIVARRLPLPSRPLGFCSTPPRTARCANKLRMVHIPATEGTPRDKTGKEKAAAPKTTAKSTPDDTLLEDIPLSDDVRDLQQQRVRGRGKSENKRSKKKPKTRANSKSEEESDPWFWGFFEGLGGDNGDGD